MGAIAGMARSYRSTSLAWCYPQPRNGIVTHIRQRHWDIQRSGTDKPARAP